MKPFLDRISRKLALRLLAAMAVTLLPNAFAQGSKATADFLSALRARYPQTRFDAVKATPLPGVFEVVMGETVAYAAGDGRHFLFGHLFDMANMKDLTAESKGKVARDGVEAQAPIRIAVSELPPLADARQRVQGKGSRVLLVFSDPACSYCSQLEQELKVLDDITVYTFLVPILPGSAQTAKRLWCGTDKDCAHPLDRNVAAMQRLGFSGTPMLLSKCGHVRAGAMPASELDTWLTAVHQECEGRR